MQKTITITELLRNHKDVQLQVQKSSEPIAVISNSKIIFYINRSPNIESTSKTKRIISKKSINNKISREEIYNQSWLDK